MLNVGGTTPDEIQYTIFCSVLFYPSPVLLEGREKSLKKITMQKIADFISPYYCTNCSELSLNVKDLCYV